LFTSCMRGTGSTGTKITPCSAGVEWRESVQARPRQKISLSLVFLAAVFSL
jgi:hypothetical protein